MTVTVTNRKEESQWEWSRWRFGFDVSRVIGHTVIVRIDELGSPLPSNDQPQELGELREDPGLFRHALVGIGMEEWMFDRSVQYPGLVFVVIHLKERC